VAASVSVLFHREDRPMDWQQLSDLKPLRIGVSLGYSYGPVLDRMLAEGQLQADSAPTDEQNLRKLAKGRIDIFPLDRDVGNFLIATSNDPSLKALTFNPKPIHTEPLYLLISRKVPDGEALARRFAAIWPKYRPLGVPLQ
jgi:polar amino acid transport system substrate-binding protein